MSKKKAAKAKAARGIRNLSAKTLTAKQARGVKGGAVDKASPVLMKYCANGTHMKEATIN
jgi:type VI protein secretion system component Hcp